LQPFRDTQRLAIANWEYLTPSLVVWSILLGCAFALIVMVQLYATSRIIGRRPQGSAVGGLAFVPSLAPSFLCVSPIVPTLLAFLGASGLGLYSTTGALQHFFASSDNLFLAVGLVLMLATGAWSLGKVASAVCLTGECEVGATSDAARDGDRGGVR